MNLNFERVIRFVTVAEEMSFTKAARRLRVDQPWLSRQIQQLEKQLGFGLFERTTRRIELTPEGAGFLEQAKRLAEAAEETRRVAHALDRGRRKELMLGCLTSTFWVPARIELLDRFASRYPGANVTIQIGAGQQLLDSLSKLHLDLAFVSPVEGLEAFDYIRLHRSRPGLFIPRAHPLLQKADTRMSDLAGLPLASMGRAANPGGYDQLYGPYFRAGMIEREVPEGSTAMLHYARAEGLCLLALNPAEEMGENMVYRDVIDTPVSVEFGLARRSGDERLLVQRLWSVAQAMAEESGIMRPRRKGAAADPDERMPKQGRRRKGG